MTTTPEPFTLRAATGLSSTPPLLSESTVLVIDVQREYEPDGLLPLSGHGEAIEKITSVLTSARAQQGHIIHIVHEGSSGGAFDPASGGRTSIAADPAGGESTLSKALPNAFSNTGLHEKLQELDTDHIVIVGFMTHMCVSSTARAALDLGYATTIVSDATATRDLPSAIGGSVVAAASVQNAALAGLADRFSTVISAAELLAAQQH